MIKLPVAVGRRLLDIVDADSVCIANAADLPSSVEIIQTLNGYGPIRIHLRRLCDAVTQCAPSDDLVSLAQTGLQALRDMGVQDD